MSADTDYLAEQVLELVQCAARGDTPYGVTDNILALFLRTENVVLLPGAKPLVDIVRAAIAWHAARWSSPFVDSCDALDDLIDALDPAVRSAIEQTAPAGSSGTETTWLPIVTDRHVPPNSYGFLLPGSSGTETP